MSKDKDDEIYSLYGKVAITFESLCDHLRLSILFHLEKYGLKEQLLSHIVISDLSAYQLILKNRAIIAFVYKDKEEIINHLDPYFKALLTLNDKRNFIIHGTWSMKYEYDVNGNQLERPKMMYGRKSKITKDGVKFENVTYGKNEFKEFYNKLVIAQKIAHFIYASRDIEELNKIGENHNLEDLKNISLLNLIKKEDIDSLK